MPRSREFVERNHLDGMGEDPVYPSAPGPGSQVEGKILV
jgi:hypothetical protein